LEGTPSANSILALEKGREPNGVTILMEHLQNWCQKQPFQQHHGLSPLLVVEAIQF
jgi:hypothetical protein